MPDLVHKDGEEEDDDVRDDEEAEVGPAAHDAHDEAEDPVDGEQVVELDGDDLSFQRDAPNLERGLPREGALDCVGRRAAAWVAHPFLLLLLLLGVCGGVWVSDRVCVWGVLSE